MVIFYYGNGKAIQKKISVILRKIYATYGEDAIIDRICLGLWDSIRRSKMVNALKDHSWRYQNQEINGSNSHDAGMQLQKYCKNIII